MAIPPLLAVGSALGAGAAAGSAAKAVGSGFAAMLRSALTKSGEAQKPAAVPEPALAPAADPAGWKAALDQDVVRFGRELAALLSGKGIEPASGFRLSLDALGKVRVADGHPDKSQIEAIFASRGELADAFRNLARRAETLPAIAGGDGHAPGAGGFGRFVLSVDPGGARYELAAIGPA